MKKNTRKALMTTALFSTLSLSTLTACNYTFIDVHYYYNKAIIFDGNTATIVEISEWTDYDGEQIQIITKDGLLLLTSSFDTKLIDDSTSDIKAEDIARAIKGDDVEINYLGASKSLTLNNN